MKITIIFFMMGMICGIVCDILKTITHLFKNNIIIQITSDFLFSTVSGLLFFSLLNQYFYGQIRLYILIIFLFGIYLEQKTLGKLFAKLYFILYNVGRKIVRKFSSSKFGKIIFK